MTVATQFDTFTIEREFAAPLARVYCAFTDPQRKRRWFAEGSTHQVEHFAMQFELGGREQARYRFNEGSPFAGVSLESSSEFLDIVPEQRIVTASTMDIGGQRISVALHSFEFASAGPASTRMLFTHQAAFFAGADGPALRRLGWQQLFAQLASSLSE
jgi:uncharacterized protein YndB with AHSA1/START domain